MATVSAQTIEVSQNKQQFLLTKLPASVVTHISYAAVRNRSDEEGAVQRVLNNARISSIKEFTLAGGAYPSALVLNWVGNNNKAKLDVVDGKLTFESMAGLAQIIDGQHRIAGIRAAIEEDKKIGKLELPLVIYRNLSTQECADLFISINTEQKPVPKSLVFDLYGIASEQVADPAAVRARDIAVFLNEESTSPYLGAIKFPNAQKRRGGVALSTVVNAVRSLVEDKGAFEQVDILELEAQQGIILNLFKAIEIKYGEAWFDTKNAFMYGSGFSAAINFLKLIVIPYCNTKGSYTAKTMEGALRLPPDELILQDDFKNLPGAEATARVYERLKTAFTGRAGANRTVEY